MSKNCEKTRFLFNTEVQTWNGHDAATRSNYAQILFWGYFEKNDFIFLIKGF